MRKKIKQITLTVIIGLLAGACNQSEESHQIMLYKSNRALELAVELNQIGVIDKRYSIYDKMADKGLLPTTKELINIDRETNNLLSWIDSLKHELVQASGGSGTFPFALPKGAQKTTIDALLLANSGKGYELEKRLNSYGARLDSVIQKTKRLFPENDAKVWISPLALPGTEDPDYFTIRKDVKNKDFVQLNFEDKTLMECLLILSTIQYEIVKNNIEVLYFVEDILD